MEDKTFFVINLLFYLAMKTFLNSAMNIFSESEMWSEQQTSEALREHIFDVRIMSQQILNVFTR